MSTAPDQLQPTSQAPSMAIPKRWPLVNTLGYRGASIGQDAQLINAYAEKDRATGLWNVEKRSGFGPTPEITGTLGGQGIFTYKYLQTSGSIPNLGYDSITIYVQGTRGLLNSIAYLVYVDANGTQHAPVSLGSVNLGYINPSGSGASAFPTKVQFTGLSTTASVGTIIFGSGAAPTIGGPLAYYYDTALHTLTPGVNGFPSGTVPGFVALDGYVYVMDYTGAIWQTSTQNQVANWSGNQITAGAEADIAIQLAKQLIYVVAIKSWSTQFFYDAGNPVGSSLSPVSGAIFNFGCISSDTFAELDGVLYWATQSKEGTYSVVEVENLQYRIISTPSVERQLDLASGGTFYAFAYQHVGHRFYVLTNVTNNVTMVYDIGEKLWYRWTDYQGNYYPIAARTVDPDGNEWHQAIATGNVYEMKGDYLYPNDYGHVVPVDIYTPNFDAGVGRQKTLWQMRFNADQVPGSKLLIRASDDDYQTWNNFRSVDLSKKPDVCILNDEGTFYRRAYHFRHYANTAFRIRSVDLQMDIGVM